MGVVEPYDASWLAFDIMMQSEADRASSAAFCFDARARLDGNRVALRRGCRALCARLFVFAIVRRHRAVIVGVTRAARQSRPLRDSRAIWRAGALIELVLTRDCASVRPGARCARWSGSAAEPRFRTGAGSNPASSIERIETARRRLVEAQSPLIGVEISVCALAALIPY